MITLKNKASIAKMQEAGQRLVEIFEHLPSMLLPGKSTLDIDSWIAIELAKKELTSKTKGYVGYKHVSCISVNDEVVHGVPSEQKKIKAGDLVKVDICASFRGYCADMARSFIVGEIDAALQELIDVAEKALNKGIEKARAGNHLSDISAAIQQTIEESGLGVVRDFAGHGIGKSMHEDPEVLNYGKPGMGPILRPGMAFALEPMITMGNYEVYIAKDGWTVKTIDKSWAAHVEDTIVVTEGEPKILTRKISAG
jgi:methionyl aminopeptidase